MGLKNFGRKLRKSVGRVHSKTVNKFTNPSFSSFFQEALLPGSTLFNITDAGVGGRRFLKNTKFGGKVGKILDDKQRAFNRSSKDLVKGRARESFLGATDFVDPFGGMTNFAADKLGGVFDEGKFTSHKEIKDIKELQEAEFQQQQADMIAEQVANEEKKRRRRRGNIHTRPLGALVSRSLLTRNLTGA